MSDGDHAHHAVHAFVDDAESPHAILPEPLKLASQRLPCTGIAGEKTKPFLDAVLHLRRERADHHGDVGWHVEPEENAHRRRLTGTGRSGSPKTSSNDNPTLPAA